MRSLFSIIFGIAVLGLFGFSQTAFAVPYVLSNSPGDGSIIVGVDGYGAFGSSVGGDSSNAIYDPVGAGGAAGTSFESGMAIGTGGTRSFLTTGLIHTSGLLPTNPTVTGSSTSGSSTFSNSGLDFALSQILQPIFTGPAQTGSILTQTYTITNPGSSTANFELVRYLDGDLLFDGSVADGGGRFITGEGTEILFETDSATGSATSTTFVGISGEGGVEPATNRYEISPWSGLVVGIIAGTPLADTVTGDGVDADEFIDAGSGYDVTLAIRNTFSLGPMGSGSDSVVYVTKTVFGSGSPEDIQTVAPVGGTIIPIDTTALIIAGIDANPYSILASFTVLGAIAFGALYLTYKKRD